MLNQNQLRKNSNTMDNFEIELELLPTGEIRFSRERKEECREFLLYIMREIIHEPKKIKEIEDFLNEADNRELILGEEILCG